MGVHCRLVAVSIGDPQHAHLIVFELDFVVIRGDHRGVFVRIGENELATLALELHQEEQGFEP